MRLAVIVRHVAHTPSVTSQHRGVAAVSVVLVALFACLLAFATLATVVRGPEIPAVDTATTAFVRDIASPGLDGVMSAITDLGSTFVVALVAVVAAVALTSRGHGLLASLPLIAVVASLALNGLLKLLVERPRPEFDWALVQQGYSFPSGHAMNSFVVYVSLAIVAWLVWGRQAGIAVLAGSLLMAIAIGVSRIYLGAHWLTDVIGGFIAATACLIIVMGSLFSGRWLLRRRQDQHPRSSGEARPL